jgi:hypothetical protein
VTSRNLPTSGIPPEDLYAMRYFYDFTGTADGVHWVEDADTGGTVTLSSFAQTGGLRLTTGTTINTGVSINTELSTFLNDGGQTLEGALRIGPAATASNKLNIFAGFSSGVDKDYIADGGSISYSGKEVAGLLKKQDDEKWWAVYSSNLGGVSRERRSLIGAGDEYDEQCNGWQSVRLLLQRQPGNITTIQYFIDSKGYGNWEPLLGDDNKPIEFTRDDSSGVTTVALAAVVKNGSTTNERLWIDWWAMNMSRVELDSSVTP